MNFVETLFKHWNVGSMRYKLYQIGVKIVNFPRIFVWCLKTNKRIFSAFPFPKLKVVREQILDITGKGESLSKYFLFSFRTLILCVPTLFRHFFALLWTNLIFRSAFVLWERAREPHFANGSKKALWRKRACSFSRFRWREMANKHFETLL